MELKFVQNIQHSKSLTSEEKKPKEVSLAAKTSVSFKAQYPINPETLKAYAGIQQNTVSKDEFATYLQKTGIKTDEEIESIIEAISDENGVITKTAFEFYKSFLGKTRNHHQAKNCLKNSKEDNEINYKALETLDKLMVPTFLTLGSRIDYATFVSKIKDTNGKFNDEVLEIIEKDTLAISRLLMYQPIRPYNFFANLKNNEGIFDQNTIDYAKQEIENGKHFDEILTIMQYSRDKKGNFSLEILKKNELLNSKFEGSTLLTLKSIYNSIPEENEEEKAALIEFAEKYKRDKKFRKIIKFIEACKEDPKNEIGLGYNQESFNFIKSYEVCLDDKQDNLYSALKASGKNFSEFTKEEKQWFWFLIHSKESPETISNIVKNRYAVID